MIAISTHTCSPPVTQDDLQEIISRPVSAVSEQEIRTSFHKCYKAQWRSQGRGRSAVALDRRVQGAKKSDTLNEKKIDFQHPRNFKSLSQIKWNETNIVLFLFLKFLINIKDGYCDYSPLITPLLTTLSISVRKIHLYVKISSLSRSVKWSFSSLFHYRNSVSINRTSTVQFWL